MINDFYMLINVLLGMYTRTFLKTFFKHVSGQIKFTKVNKLVNE